ncbi:MAG: hypothetical protein ABI456_15600 [Ktedonobacteraceae bacterium]
MLRLSVPTAEQERRWHLVVLGLMALETILVLLAMVPAELWTRLLPQASDAALDGPFPASIAPMITVLLYLLPALIGFMCQAWQRALLYATLPAWIGLGIFLIAATSRIGAFALIASDRVVGNVGVLELFALLGGIGWLGRYVFKLQQT